MRALNLDYCRRPPLITAAGLVWLALGLAVLAAALEQYRDVQEELERQENRVDSLTEQLTRKTKARERMASEAKKREPELKEAQAVLRRLTTPWEEVFGALEQATRVHRDRIRVLGVQPDMDKGLVLLTGEAKGLDDLMDYLDRLGSGGSLRRARLVSHQMQVELPGRPIRFYAVAEWSTGS